jgi:hypothetical protein
MPMGLFSRRSRDGAGTAQRAGLAGDAAAVRATLTALQVEREGTGAARVGEVDLRGMVRLLLEGDVAAPTADVRWLVDHDTDPEQFYEREVAPSWEGLSEDQRAGRLEGYLDLVQGLEQAGDAAGLQPEMRASAQTRALLLAWAFDETYGYLARLARGESGD